MPNPRRQTPHTNPAGDRLPPHSIEAEQGVLGCVLLDPMRCMSDCAEVGLAAEWFYDIRHRMIWEAMVALDRDAKGADVLLLRNALQASGNLEKVGGDTYLTSLPDCVPSSANLPHYLEMLEERHMARCLLRSCAQAVSRIYAETEGAVEEIVCQAEKEIQAIAEVRFGSREQAVKPLLLDVIDRLEVGYHRGSAQIVGLTTGLVYVDKLLCGLGGENGNMIVVAGRPGTGKTSWALDVALHVALDYRWFSPQLDGAGQVIKVDDQVQWDEHRGVPVGIFSLEMSATSLVKKMLFQRAQADIQRWRTGYAQASDFPKLTKASAEISKAPIWIDDTGRCSIGELRAKARRWVRQYGIKLFIVDYIQLMRTDSRRFRDDRVQELAEISGELQNLGKTLNIPFILLAQMNRDYEKEPNRQPRLSDLKDCGAIEQDADMVGFLYAPKLKEKAKETFDLAMEKEFGDDWSQYPKRIDLLVAKNRFGPTGSPQMLFQNSCTHFLDYVEWLKCRGHKDSAEGERTPTMPPNEEMNL